MYQFLRRSPERPWDAPSERLGVIPTPVKGSARPPDPAHAGEPLAALRFQRAGRVTVRFAVQPVGDHTIDHHEPDAVALEKLKRLIA